jgi:hypothetical protein
MLPERSWACMLDVPFEAKIIDWKKREERKTSEGLQFVENQFREKSADWFASWDEHKKKEGKGR